METQNELKAKEIAKNIVGNDHYSYFDDFKLCAMQAMEWKDNRLGNWLDILNKEIDKLTTGNLAHNKTHIKCLLYEIQEQLKGK